MNGVVVEVESGMEPAVETPTADAIASVGDVRAVLLEVRTLLAERQRLTDRLAVVQRDLDEKVAVVRALEGRS